MENIVTIQLRLRVIDEDALRAAADQIEHGAESLEEVICTAIITPSRAPLDCGFEIKSKKAMQIADGHMLEVICDVFDEQMLAAEAKACYQACWQDADWEPVSVEDALYEVLVASNSNPAPCDMGYELTELDPKLSAAQRRAADSMSFDA